MQYRHQESNPRPFDLECHTLSTQLRFANCLCTLLQAIMVELSLYNLLHLALMDNRIHKHLSQTHQVHTSTHQQHNHIYNIDQPPQALSIGMCRSHSQMNMLHHLLLTMRQCQIWKRSKYWIKHKITKTWYYMVYLLSEFDHQNLQS